MGKFRLDFWRKSFYEETTFGQIVTGKNKVGQALGVVKDSLLTYVPLIGKPLKEITGHVTDSGEAEKIGKSVEELNLSPKTILIIRAIAVGIFGYLLIKNILTMEEVKELWEMLGVMGL